MKARFFLLIALFVLSACGKATDTPTVPAATTTAPAATPRLSTATAAATILPSATGPALTVEAGTSASTSTATGPLLDRAAFVADVTVPDGTKFGPGATFTKTWRIKNVGTSTWTKEYVLEFALGANMANVAKINLPNDVSPNATVDISVEMTTPTTPGAYTSLWQFKSPAGAKFGVGANFDEAIYAQIEVAAGLPVGTQGATTPVPTASGPLNPIKVSKISISADAANFTGECPHTFVFTALIDLSGGGVMKYQLEVSTTTPGFQLQLPEPIESTFTTNGPQTFGASFTLEMRDTVQGQAWLHILSPVDMLSDKTPFSLTCPVRPTSTPLFTQTPAVSATP
jgi:Ig-like domain from next to BRCA1 gene